MKTNVRKGDLLGKRNCHTVMHIEAIRKEFEPINTKALAKLPKNKSLMICYAIQYKPLAQNIKKYLSPTHDVIGFKQVLGCTKLKSKVPILLIADGKFHATNLAIQNDAPIYIYTAGKIERFSNKDIELIKKRKKGALLKFLDADKIGILVSTKPGQNRLKEAKKLKKQLEKIGKLVYIFIANEIDLKELENFKIDSWVNTACPGLAFDSPEIINIDDLSSEKIV